MPATIPGYHLMQLGVSPRPLLLDCFSNLHRFTVAEGEPRPGISCSTMASFNELPLPGDTLDAVLLHHALEFSRHPHVVLRDVVRTIIPGGHLILVVFNPYSVFGMIKGIVRPVSSKAVWQHHGLRRGRILDWLKVLHCQTLWQGQGGYSFPASDNSWLRHLDVIDDKGFAHQPPCGAFYVIVARKQVARPIMSGRRVWRAKPVSNNLFSLKGIDVENS